MVNYRGVFISYLQMQSLFTEQVVEMFDLYHRYLHEENKKINLFSRQMSPDEIWLKHFLDSVSITEVYRGFTAKRILDFGTGGGLPGIPLKILFPDCEMSFLDSTQKKIASVKRICERLCLDKTHFYPNRVELLEKSRYFDVIVSRGVKMTHTAKKAMSSLLTDSGKVFLYKSRDLTDTEIFDSKKIHTLHISELGERKIVEIGL